MAEVLVVYWSQAGQTAAVAERIGQTLRTLGHRVVLSAGHDHPEMGPEGFDAVVVGASIHRGHHPADLLRWLRAHREPLRGLPTAFFSVSLSAASTDPEEQRAARRIMEQLLEEAQWQPRRSASIAGAVHFGRYGLLTRWIMRAIIRRKDPAAAGRQDHEYTDWNAVERFATDFAAELPQRAGPRPPPDAAGPP